MKKKLTFEMRIVLKKSLALIVHHSGEGGGGLPVVKYFRPSWLADEEKFSFQIV